MMGQGDGSVVSLLNLGYIEGARDHYHELENEYDQNSCKFKDVCSECGTNKRAETCIMNHSRINITSDTVICEACQNEIIAHLESHHIVEGKENER